MKQTLLRLIVLASSALLSCKDNTPDPCKDQKPTSASFRMEQKLGLNGKSKSFAVDTVGATGRVGVVFTAEESDADTYEWQFGNESQPRYGRSVALAFQNPYQEVAIKLTVKKAPNSACFPDDDGIDTQQKKLVVIPEDKVPIIGVYEGHNLSAPGTRFRITIGQYDILNLPRGSRYGMRGEFLLGARAVYVFSQVFSQEYGAGAVNGWGALDEKNRDVLRFEYDTFDTSVPVDVSPRLHEVFVGTRVK